MDLWLAIGLAVGTTGIIVSIYYGRRSSRPRSQGPKVIVKVSNAIPVYDLPGGSRKAGDHYVSVEAVHTGDRTIAITGWGVKLPGSSQLVVTRPVSWSTQLPHELRPGAPPAQFMVPADELRQLERERHISYEDMHPYVKLADGTEVFADRSVPFE